MPSYETLDSIADAYTPALGIIWLILIAYPITSRQWRITLGRALLGISALLIAYGFMWLDNVYKLWLAIGLDYSTHSAVSFALAIVIYTFSRKLGLPIFVSLLTYFLLMLYQRYHTIGDIVSTVLVISGPLSLLVYCFNRLARRAIPNSVRSIRLLSKPS